ncbi:histidine phosphatase family protein [Thioclava sp. BHET1]|nr:histidine phosphatase family protein [Thioclava sp. BHET1]
MQALSAGEALGFRIGDLPVLIVTSPLGRARQTAQLLASRLRGPVEIREDARLAEIGMGSWDGLTRAEIEARAPGHRKAHGPGEWYFSSPDGESYEAIRTRLAAALEDVRADPAPCRILVSHGVAGRVLRGLHGGLSRAETVTQDAPQNAAFLLGPGGALQRIDYDDG